MRVEKTVFISYRRSASKYLARAIYEHLSNHGFDVFLDYEKIDAGDFEHTILSQVDARAHFIPILTPGSVERFSDDADWFRREIERAIETKRNIVPLIVEGFDFSRARPYLTGKLAMLDKYQAVRVPDDYFDEAMARLRTRFLSKPLDVIVHPVSRAMEEEVARRKAEISAMPAPSNEELKAEDYFNRGYDRQEIGDLRGAIEAYTRAIELNPNYAEAYNNRGNARDDSGDPHGAIADYTEAIRSKPDYATAYYNRGIVRKSVDDIEGAIADYTEAIRLNPQYAEAYNNRGNARDDNGDPEGALADYNEALRLKPDYDIAYNNRGVVRKSQGDIDGAIADYSEAIRLNPEYAVAYNNRAIARKAKGDMEGAVADFSEAIRLNPDYATAYNSRGAILDDRGDYDAAIADYTEAIRCRPDYIDAFYNRGLSRRKKGDYRDAIDDYQRYLDLGGGIRDGDQAQVEQTIRELWGKINA
ncbi:MAG: hypothetical protein Kow0077_14530 [Anaerolineae bacterium]